MPEYLHLIHSDAPDDPSPDARSRTVPMGDELDAYSVQLRTGTDATARGALETIFRACYTPLIEFAATYVHSADIAEDIVASCFARLWEHRTTLAPVQGIVPFLFGSIRNRALNAQRDASAHHRSEGRIAEAAGIWAGAPMATPDSAVQHQELVDAVWTVVATLSERERTLLALRWEHGMTWVEVAAILRISPNAAEVLHRRALRTLRHLFPRGFR